MRLPAALMPLRHLSPATTQAQPPAAPIIRLQFLKASCHLQGVKALRGRNPEDRAITIVGTPVLTEAPQHEIGGAVHFSVSQML